MKIIPNSVTQAGVRAALQIKKNSPHILFGAGIAGAIGSTVLACRSTLKLDGELTRIKRSVEDIHALEEVNEDPKVTQKAITVAYGKGAIDVVRLYAPSIVLGAVSIGALTGAHIQMNKRNAALTATLGAVTKAYDEYRERVRAEVGDDRELEIYRATDLVEVAGEKDLVAQSDPTIGSIYAKTFDKNNPNWRKDADHNRIFIDCQQRYFNDRLQTRGHVFLNEVYDGLGIERTSPGAVVGWVVNDSDGDNYIDFGLYEERCMDFVDGHELNIWLDFNVDGIIYDKI